MGHASSHHEPALTTEKLRRHIPVLDGIRGLAIVLVLFHHCTDMSNNGLADDAATLLLHWGGFGVDLFFVLSGFLITGILADTRGHRGYFRSFYARRVLRIFPLYYAVVIFSFIILPNIGPVLAATPGVPDSTAATIESKLDRFGTVGEDEWFYWLYLSNFLAAKVNEWRHGILDVSWSLAIEEQFYLLWPLLVWLVGQARMKVVCLALLVVSPAFRAWLLLRGTDPFFGGETTIIDVYVLTPGRLEGLALGSLLALHLRGGGDDLAPHRRLRALVGPAKIVAPVCLGLSVLGEATRHLADHPVHSHTLFTAYAGYTLVAIGFAAVLVLALAAEPGSFWFRFWTSRPLRSFGKYSYAIYLTHMPVRAVIRDLVYGPNFNGSRFGDALFQFPRIGGSELPGQILFFIPAFAACWVVGWLSWNLYEKHFLKLKRFFPYERKVRQGGAPPSGGAVSG
jgi:peptidoglycan/LPS O-acetylase OafA/YrhL